MFCRRFGFSVIAAYNRAKISAMKILGTPVDTQEKDSLAQISTEVPVDVHVGSEDVDA